MRIAPGLAYHACMVTETVDRASLTQVEQALVDHVTRGEWLDLVGDGPTDEATMQSWDSSRTVRAIVVRDILRGRLAPDPDPHGLRLRGARIAGRIDLDNVNTTVAVEFLDCFLAEGLTAWNARIPALGLEGCHVNGEVSLAGAHLGVLACGSATLRNDSGPALYANGIRVDYGLILCGGFSAEGAGERGAIHLCGARVGGWLNCSDSKMRNNSGAVLKANQMKATLVRLSDGFDAVGGGEGVVVDLTGVKIEGTLVFEPARLEHSTDPHARLRLDGLTYSGLPVGITFLQWLRLLRDATPSYAAQPYQQLASAHRAAGHDGEAHQILMAQRRDQIHQRALTGRAERTWARLTGLTLGYGYQPWRALFFLLAVVVTAVILAVTVGAYGGLARTQPPTSAAPQCTAVERIGVGLDLALPLIRIGNRGHCDTTTSTAGQVLTVTGWGLQLASWAFATLFIAGFTSAVRKT